MDEESIERLNAACAAIGEAFRNLAEAFNKIKKAISEEERKASNNDNAKKYGECLYRSKIPFKKYDYRPYVRRNLPYQRRSY